MILIVDDKQENIFSLKTLLEINKFEVDTALSGEEALKKVLKNKYFLIILDVQMPGIDGFEVAETISGYSKAKDIPIIFVSAVNTDKRFVAKGYASGGLDYITKPIDPDLLLLKVRTFYRIYSQNNELKIIHRQLESEIEQRKKAEQELQETNQKLEELVDERTQSLVRSKEQLEQRNNELETFVHITSHDLTEPLRKIRLFGDMVKIKIKSKELPSATDLVEKMISSSARMIQLTQELLTYSRLSSSGQLEMVNIQDVITGVENDLELLIKEKNAVIDVSALPQIEANPLHFRLIIQNLLANALKFTRPNIAPHIRITGETVDGLAFDANVNAEGKYLRMKFADNGIGFDKKYKDKIFVIFQRLNKREEYSGTGMGLAIVKKIIDRHEGIITADSDEGRGSVFTCVLPLQQTA